MFYTNKTDKRRATIAPNFVITLLIKKMNDTLYIGNSGQWLIETYVPMWQDYECLFNSDPFNLVEPAKHNKSC